MKTPNIHLCFGIIVALVCWATRPSDAKVINAVSCQFTDVSNAVAQASPGDVVQLPAGTNWWSETLELTNGISLIGSGTNSTVLIDEENHSGGSPQIINFYPAVGVFSEIANIQFTYGVTNTVANYYGAIAAYGVTGSSWRIDHNVFNQLYAKGIVTYGNAAALIDHNTFYEREISISVNNYFPGDGEGDLSWSSPPTYGPNSSTVLYVENNMFTNTVGYVASVGATDGVGGSRIVFRNNIVWNDLFNNHGTETGGLERSQRSFEIYNNTFIATYSIYSACMIRGGSGVIFSNTVTGPYGGIAELRTYRYTCSYLNEWSPYGGANGLSPYDSNDPTLYLTGTSSAPNGSAYLQVNGANWTPNQWYGYTVIDTNTGVFSVITGNTPNAIYFIGSSATNIGVVACTPLTFNQGDTFQIRRVYAALDQIGRGSGQLLKDLYNPSLVFSNGIIVTINAVTGTEAWPNEPLEGLYAWGNTMNGAPVGLMSYYPTLQAGRDFYNSPMPGYTPYVYPHPLESQTYVAAYTNSPPPTNSTPPTNGLQPPTNFHQVIGNP